MRQIYRKFRALVHAIFPTERERQEAWLAQSVDRVDLEQRLILLDRAAQRQRSWMAAGF